jgi:glycine cleavage system protein P-like pyridoxal-binding family
MPSTVAEFQRKFITARGIDRVQLVTQTALLNTNYQIKNLLQNIDMNDTSEKNKTKASNIYWICGQLMAFSDFVVA